MKTARHELKTGRGLKAIKLTLCSLVVGLCAFSASADNLGSFNNTAATSPLFSGSNNPNAYLPVASVVPSLSQVVFYYPQGNGPATIYVDSELQSALLPGEFTVFCVAPGAHAIESHINDQPRYQGKFNPSHKLNAEGATTYFLQVNPGENGNTATLVERSEAESILKTLNKQTRIVDRASQVRGCEYVNNAGVVLVQEQVLFRFAKSNYGGILPESQARLDNVINLIKQANVSGIQVLGYTDAIGNRQANQRLSEARAQTVREALVSGGVNPGLITSTNGLGVAQTAEGCGTSAKQQSNGCNVNSRRVDIIVSGH